MRILIIMGGFFPGKKYGGPPVSVDNFCTLMGDKYECYIVTHNHDMDEEEIYSDINEGWNLRDNAKVLYLSNQEYCYKVFRSIAKSIEPDYLYLQGLFQECIFPCLRLAKELNIKVMLAPRGELCVGAFKKKYKKIPYIICLKALGLLKHIEYQSTSEEETGAIMRYLGASPERIHFLTNIPSIPHSLSTWRRKEQGAGRFIFISRIVRKKNLISAISFFKGIKGQVLFDIYGPIEDEQYWKECESLIIQMDSNIEIKYKGIIPHDAIHDTFTQYDSFLFPTFSENYGHVIAEALLAGCIPIISDQTPWTDLNETSAGWALPLDSINRFKDAIQSIVNMDEETICQKRRLLNSYTEDKLQIATLKKKYIDAFRLQ